jgi:chromosome partitioning protein
MRRIALVNQKGGCGKTTTAVNLSACLADLEKKVLLLDLDPQGHAALGLGVNTDEIETSIYEVLTGEKSISEAIFPIKENLHTIFSDVVLSAFEQVMAGASGREYQLAHQLRAIEKEYEYIIMDSPPSVGLLTFNGLMAADEVIIPVDPSYFSLQGLGKLLDTLRILKEKANHDISIRILATNIDGRTVFCKKVVDALQNHFHEECLQTVIRNCTKIREAASRGKPIGEYDRHCIGYDDYLRLTEEIVCGAEKSAEPHLRTQFAYPQKPPAPAEQMVTFKIKAPPHANVQIAGDFNRWQPQNLQLHLDGNHDGPFWLKEIPLKPGTYQYKFLIDGHWTADPENRAYVDNALGGVNSLIQV